MNGLAPFYLSELLHAHAPARALRSYSQLLLEVPRTRFKMRGDHAFGVAALELCISLPPHIRYPPTLELFTSLLNTYLFSKQFLSVFIVFFLLSYILIYWVSLRLTLFQMFGHVLCISLCFIFCSV